MKRKVLAILVASLAATAMPVTAWAGPGGGNGGGKGGDHGGPGGSSGQGKGGGKAAGASGFAPGKSRSDLKETGRAFAPGQLKKAAVDDDDVIATGSFGKLNFGTVISSIRAGKSSLAGVDADTVVNVVDVADLIRGNNRVALDNALVDRADEIDVLRDDLAALGLADLDAATIDDAVAVRQARNGTLTVFVYDDN